jgi:spore germination protein (amino acid permease)
MKEERGDYLTQSQLTLILVGSMIGTGALTLPLDVIKTAQQDGWISCIIGSVYPFYMVFIAQHIHKKFPGENILMLYKRYLGKIWGNVLNFVFILYFLLMGTEVAAGMTNVLLIYMTSFLTRYKIILILLLAPAFVAYKGLKTLGRVNEVVFYSTLIAFLIPIPALKNGSVLNLMPVFGSGVVNIIKTVKDTALAYGGIEIIFLIYPFLKNNKKLKKCGITSVIITGIVYTWFTFISIFYLGVDIIPKFLWPIVTVAEAITIPIINSFRYIFMVLWTTIMLKLLSCYYYGLTFSLSQITKIVNRKSLVIFIYPLVFYLSTRYQNPAIRRGFLDKIIPIYTLYNIAYVSVIALLITLNPLDKAISILGAKNRL